MRSKRRFGITALTAAVALAIGAVPVALTVPSILASGELGDGPSTTIGAATTVPQPSAGQLTLRTWATAPSGGEVTWSKDDSLIQTFAEGSTSCMLTVAPESADLLTLTGILKSSTAETLGRESFRGGSIGVNEGVNNAQCFRVDAGSFTANEILRLELGENLSLGTLAESASLDIELRANSMVIEATTYLGVEQTGKYQLRTGTAVASSTPPSSGVVTPSTARSGAHVDWRIDTPDTNPYFDRIELDALTGSFQLEGGADTGAGPTTVDLVQPGETLTCPGTLTDQLGTENAEVIRLGNADDSACTDFGALLRAGDSEIVFLKPLDVDPTAQFLIPVTWSPETPPGAEGGTMSGLTIEFDLPDGTLTDPVDMEFCPKFLYNKPDSPADDPTRTLEGVTTSQDLADLADDDMVPLNGTSDPLPGTQFACVGEPRTATKTSSSFTIKDTIYLLGDARMRLG